MFFFKKIATFFKGDNIAIDRALIALLIILFSSNLINILDYIYFILDSAWFLEPAENENLVFTNYLLHNSVLDINSLMKNGIIPIYPDFYHQFTSLFGDNTLKNLRIVSAICFLLSYFVIMIWALKVTKLIFPTLALPVLIFGTGDHSLFFLMGRVDAIYFFTGLFTLFILFTLYYRVEGVKWVEPKYLNLLLALSGIILAISLLSKQTSIFFLIFSIFIIIYFKNKEPYFKELFLFLSFTILTLIAYSYFVNTEVASYYMSGLKLFSNKYSINSLLSHVYTILKDYGFYIFLTLIGLFSIKKDKSIFIFWILASIFVSTVSIKIFGNVGAFSNNFILLTSMVTIFIIYTYKKSSELMGSNLINLIIIFTVILNMYPGVTSGNYSNYFSIAKDKQISNKKIEKSVIFKYIKENQGSYLTGRGDNLLLHSNRSVKYEASAMNVLIKEAMHIEKSGLTKIHQLSLDLKNNIDSKIRNQSFQGIVTGIGKGLLSIYPIIDIYYKPYLVQKIHSGPHQFDIVLYVRRGLND
jgi:hypothetical protein